MNKKAEHYWRKILYWRPIRRILHTSRLLVLPGFQGVPLFDVLLFFVKGLTKGELNQRSAAMSYHFFLSLFPMVLFLFTLLPFLHLESYAVQILVTIHTFLPESAYLYVEDVIADLVANKHTGLMSVGIVSSIYVASSGVNFLILTLTKTQNNGKMKFFKRRLLSIGLVIGLSIGLIISITLILFSKNLLLYLILNETIKTFFQYYVLKVLKWCIIIFLIYLAFAIMYYVVLVDKKGYKFFSAGATLGTILFILMSMGFNLYIEHFSRYNALYGSIGAMIIFLLWIYLSCYVLLIGFELNTSIAIAYTQGRSKTIDSKDLHISRSGKNMGILASINRRIKFYIRKRKHS